MQHRAVTVSKPPGTCPKFVLLYRKLKVVIPTWLSYCRRYKASPAYRLGGKGEYAKEGRKNGGGRKFAFVDLVHERQLYLLTYDTVHLWYVLVAE